MNIKLTALTAGILTVFSTGAMSAGAPPSAVSLLAPDGTSIYGNGPGATRLNTTDLSVAERSAFALMEAVMQIAEAKIYATSCGTSPQVYNLEVYADGLNHAGTSITDTIYNQATITGSGGSNAPQFSVGATLGSVIPNRGQQVLVALQAAGSLGGTSILSYTATHTFNNLNNMMVNTNASITLNGVNGSFAPDTFQGGVIKDFFRGSTRSTDLEYYNIYDWGLQSVSKAGYPVNKWWQSSKVHRDNSVNGHTTWVKDRLVGSGNCRITIDTQGYNDPQPLYWQGNAAVGPGTLTIEPVAPNTPISWF